MPLGLAADAFHCSADQATQYAYAACVHKARSMVLHELLLRRCFRLVLGIVYSQCGPRRLARRMYSPEVQGDDLQKPQQRLVDSSALLCAERLWLACRAGHDIQRSVPPVHRSEQHRFRQHGTKIRLPPFGVCLSHDCFAMQPSYAGGGPA